MRWANHQAGHLVAALSTGKGLRAFTALLCGQDFRAHASPFCDVFSNYLNNVCPFACFAFQSGILIETEVRKQICQDFL